MMIGELKISVVGLGYVGLPIAVALSKVYDVIGFDVNGVRVSDLSNMKDSTGEVSSDELERSSIRFTDKYQDLAASNVFIVAVPTPVADGNKPDFSMLRSACRLIGSVLQPGSTIVFESTVYPGATEEICGPELEKASGFTCGKDFKLAYSPERINPGDKDHPLERIVKVVSGQDAETLDLVAAIYGSVVEAGIHRASSIKVAEAAKVLENTQRDINIALMNEMSKICDRAGVRTSEVLRAAETKWNFLKFSPGLVGGHCIGVDPYYLTSKAEQLGYHPEVILAGRRINDSMPGYVADRIVKLLAKHDVPINRAKVGILGITFKENVPDTRNSKVVELYEALVEYGIVPLVSDPLADPVETRKDYGIELESHDLWRDLDVVIFAVPHQQYANQIVMLADSLTRPGSAVIDLKAIIDPMSLRQDVSYWSL
ncbi:MAG TPA: nucleotide sugar dehydrogenase [Sphingobium sp.]|nr:nucleotide sugar dehydrogenase [Sphingobium sp.]